MHSLFQEPSYVFGTSHLAAEKPFELLFKSSCIYHIVFCPLDLILPWALFLRRGDFLDKTLARQMRMT